VPRHSVEMDVRLTGRRYV